MCYLSRQHSQLCFAHTKGPGCNNTPPGCCRPRGSGRHRHAALFFTNSTHPPHPTSHHPARHPATPPQAADPVPRQPRQHTRAQTTALRS